MKNIIVIFILCCIGVDTYARVRHHTDVVSQQRKGQHEVSVSCGLISSMEVLQFLNGQSADKVTSASLNYFGSYKYYVFNFMAVGIAAGRQTLNLESSGFHSTKYYIRKDVDNTVALELTFAYPMPPKKNNLVSIYGLLGFGYTFSSSTYSDNRAIDKATMANIQFTPLGIRVGHSFAGFVEFGAGYKGLLNGGFLYDFGWNKQ